MTIHFIFEVRRSDFVHCSACVSVTLPSSSWVRKTDAFTRPRGKHPHDRQIEAILGVWAASGSASTVPYEDNAHRNRYCNGKKLGS